MKPPALGAAAHPQRSGLLCGLLVAVMATIAGAQTAPTPFAPFASQVLAIFPKLEGEVIEVHGTQLTLSLGRRDGLNAGVEMSLYREGRELRHPKTGEILGRTEQSLGRVSVTQVNEGYSLATTAQVTDARPGDRVRISAGKIKVAVIPLSSGVKDDQVEAAVQELVEELNRTGRFQVMLGEAVSARLAQQGIAPEQAIEGKGLVATAKQLLPAEYFLPVLFTRVQNKPFMEIRLYPETVGSALYRTALFVPASLKPQPRGQQFSANPQQAPVREKPRSLLARLLGLDQESGTYSSGQSSIPLKEIGRFGFSVLSMDVAVAPQDKVPRLVITDGSKIYLYRIAQQALEPEWTYSAGAVGTVITVQLADLDGDGVLEVVANRYHPQENIGLTSFVLGTKNGKPVMVVDDPAETLLAIDEKGTGVRETLWTQRFTPEGFFTKGQADRYVIQNGKLVRQGSPRVPSDFRATGAVMTNIVGKDALRSLAYVDDRNRLAIAVESEERWRSSVLVGSGSYLQVEVIQPFQQTTRSVFYSFAPLPLAVDLDGDGIEEIVVPQNQTEGTLAVVFRSPGGFRLQLVNTGFQGTITGMGSFKTEEQSAPTLVTTLVRFKGFGPFKSADETRILMTVPD